MRTFLMTLVGVALAVAFDAVDTILRRGDASRASGGARLFVLVWLGIVAVDFCFGVAAGNAVSREAAVHALILAVPAAAAWYLVHRHRTPPAMPD
jgi:hypothetical protein